MTREEIRSPAMEPQLLPYAAKLPPRPWFSWVAFVASSCVMILAAGVLLVMVPKFKQIFADFNAHLPAPTRLLLTISNGLGAMQWALVVLLPAGIGFLTPRLYSRRAMIDATPAASKHQRNVAILVVFLFALLVFVLVVLPLILPMISLIEGISSNSRGH